MGSWTADVGWRQGAAERASTSSPMPILPEDMHRNTSFWAAPCTSGMVPHRQILGTTSRNTSDGAVGGQEAGKKGAEGTVDGNHTRFLVLETPKQCGLQRRETSSPNDHPNRS
jgi:hypothetical protein